MFVNLYSHNRFVAIVTTEFISVTRSFMTLLIVQCTYDKVSDSSDQHSATRLFFSIQKQLV